MILNEHGQTHDGGSFITSSGKRVHLEALHIELSLIGFMEGDPLYIREEILGRLQKTIDRKLGNTGLLLVEPPPGPLPLYTLYASFHCPEPIQSGNDCSSLTLVWFSDSLPSDLQQELRTRFKDVNWEAYAKDGIY